MITATHESRGAFAYPPDGADPLLWRLAQQLHRDHRADAHGWCTAPTCRRNNQLWPCPANRLSDIAFGVATGNRTTWPRTADPAMC